MVRVRTDDRPPGEGWVSRSSRVSTRSSSKGAVLPDRTNSGARDCYALGDIVLTPFLTLSRPIRPPRTNHRPPTRQPIPRRARRRPRQGPHAIRPRAGIREILQQLFTFPPRRSFHIDVEYECGKEAEVYEAVYRDHQGEGGEVTEGIAGCWKG